MPELRLRLRCRFCDKMTDPRKWVVAPGTVEDGVCPYCGGINRAAEGKINVMTDIPCEAPDAPFIQTEQAQKQIARGFGPKGYTRLVEEVPGVENENKFFIYKSGFGKLWNGKSKADAEAWARDNKIPIHAFEPFTAEG